MKLNIVRITGKTMKKDTASMILFAAAMGVNFSFSRKLSGMPLKQVKQKTNEEIKYLLDKAQEKRLKRQQRNIKNKV